MKKKKQKKGVAKTISLQTVGIILLLMVISPTIQPPVDFSGTWARNTASSDVSEGLSMNTIPVELTIKQNKDQFEITRTSKNAAGESYTYTETIKFDGTQSKATARFNTIKKSTIKATEDTKGFIEESEFTNDKGEFVQKMTDTITFLNDGKTLQIKSFLDDGKNVYKMVEVFDRK